MGNTLNKPKSTQNNDEKPAELQHGQSRCSCGNLADPEIPTGIPMCRKCYEETLSMKKAYRATHPGKISIDKILDNLYLGNEDASLDLQTLEDRNITHILVAGSYMEEKFPDRFAYKTLPIEDRFGQDLNVHLKPAIKFIQQAKDGKVAFVHCAAGVSRSPAVVIAYLMSVRDMSYENAFEFVKKSREEISPNPGFVKQLKNLEELIKNKEFTLD